MNGIVKWFNSRKGYGFITPEGTPEGAENADVFVHHSNIKMEGFRVLYQNDKVTFDVEDGQKGKEAKNVNIVERAPRPKRKRGPRTPKAEGEEGAKDAPKEEEGAKDAPKEEGEEKK